jgi:hypothetical protein
VEVRQPIALVRCFGGVEDEHAKKAELAPPIDAWALGRWRLRSGLTKLIRRDAHVFSDVSEPLAKFSYQSLNVGEMVIDGLEATSWRICHGGGL